MISLSTNENEMNNNDITINNTIKTINKNDFVINIYRYKFTNEFTDELYKFSKIHQYDHKNDFKEAWNIWIKDNDDIVSQEVRRVTNLGYNGDVITKMFKSARYYFRKKNNEQKEQVTRRNYVGVQKEILESMDKHIETNIKNNSKYKPADAFQSYCNEHKELLKEEIKGLLKIGFNDPNEIKNKIKKTYKNRYFLLQIKKN
jgi:hypothetical protein